MSEFESDPSVPFESKRVPFERTVILKFDRFSGFIKEYSANISMGGMFIRTNQMQEPGSVFEFVFKLADDYNLIQGLGEVVWVRTEDKDEDPRPSGMGIRFLELDWESRKLIFRLVDQYIQEGGVPFDVEKGPDASTGAQVDEEKELMAALSIDDENLQDIVDEEVEGVISAAPWPDDPGVQPSSGSVPIDTADAEDSSAAPEEEADDSAEDAKASAAGVLSVESVEAPMADLGDQIMAEVEADLAADDSDEAEFFDEVDEAVEQEPEDEAAASVGAEEAQEAEDAPQLDEQGSKDVETLVAEPAEEVEVAAAVASSLETAEAVSPDVEVPDVEMPDEGAYVPYSGSTSSGGGKRRSALMIPLALLLLAFVGFFWLSGRGGDDSSVDAPKVAQTGAVKGSEDVDKTPGGNAASSETPGSSEAVSSAAGEGANLATQDSATDDSSGDLSSEATDASASNSPDSGAQAASAGGDQEKLKDRQDPESKEAWKQAKASVRAWAAAWSNQDAEGYLSFYSRDYRPADGTERSAWAAKRRQRINAPSYIGVELSDFKLKLTKPGLAQAEFEQRYESNTFSDVVRKVLTLKWEDGQWKILEEEAG